MTYESQQRDAILDFWFGEIQNGDVTDETKRSMWFNGTSALDQDIRERFLAVYEAGMRGELGSWQDTARGSLALVVLLDQFPLNMFRRSARAFESENAAVAACQHAMATGQDKTLAFAERVFLYMPLMHAESLELQKSSVVQFNDLAATASENNRESAEHTAKFANNHHDIVQQFGRFPHRNAVLNRPNTDAEDAYLADSPPSYGQ